MKVNLKLDKDGCMSSFELEPDHNDPGDVRAVNHIRNTIFFTTDKELVYDGRTNSTDTCAGTLKFKMQSAPSLVVGKEVEGE